MVWNIVILFILTILASSVSGSDSWIRIFRRMLTAGKSARIAPRGPHPSFLPSIALKPFTPWAPPVVYTEVALRTIEADVVSKVLMYLDPLSSRDVLWSAVTAPESHSPGIIHLDNSGRRHFTTHLHIFLPLRLTKSRAPLYSALRRYTMSVNPVRES
jgi:hypothetical protein